jgi:hypothetical protein
MTKSTAYRVMVAAWLATGVAVIFAVYITKSAAPLWAFVLPAGLELTKRE